MAQNIIFHFHFIFILFLILRYFFIVMGYIKFAVFLPVCLRRICSETKSYSTEPIWLMFRTVSDRSVADTAARILVASPQGWAENMVFLGGQLLSFTSFGRGRLLLATHALWHKNLFRSCSHCINTMREILCQSCTDWFVYLFIYIILYHILLFQPT